MSREQTIKAIETMSGFLDGKTIQHYEQGGWVDFEPGWFPYWNWESVQYRIKPEPLEIDIWWRPDDVRPTCVTAINGMPPENSGYVKKRFREIL